MSRRGLTGEPGVPPYYSGEMEVERVEEVDGRVRRVHGDVVRHVEERLRVVEDDLHARVYEPVGDLLCVRGRHRDHADDDVLLADDAGQSADVPDLERADRSPDLLR